MTNPDTNTEDAVPEYDARPTVSWSNDTVVSRKLGREISREEAARFNEGRRPGSIEDGPITTVIDKQAGRERAWDIYSSLMKERGIIWLTGEVNDQQCELLKAELLYLDSDPAVEKIQIYIDSPGGSVWSGLSVVDVMMEINKPVATIIAGMAASMGSVIAAAGTPGMRTAFPNAHDMVHQPSGGGHGKQTEVGIGYLSLQDCRNRLETLYTLWMGLDTDNPDDIALAHTLLEHDTWLTGYMSQKVGLVDTIKRPQKLDPVKDAHKAAYFKVVDEQNKWEFDQIALPQRFGEKLARFVERHSDDPEALSLKEEFNALLRSMESNDLRSLKEIVLKIADRRDHYIREHIEHGLPLSPFIPKSAINAARMALQPPANDPGPAPMAA